MTSWATSCVRRGEKVTEKTNTSGRRAKTLTCLGTSSLPSLETALNVIIAQQLRQGRVPLLLAHLRVSPSLVFSFWVFFVTVYYPSDALILLKRFSSDMLLNPRNEKSEHPSNNTR